MTKTKDGNNRFEVDTSWMEKHASGIRPNPSEISSSPTPDVVRLHGCNCDDCDDTTCDMYEPHWWKPNERHR